MAMHNGNAFWAAQEPSNESNNAELFLHADTPTGSTTDVMANKRKDTLSKRHKGQLRRLFDIQIEEHRALRKKVSDQCTDEARNEYFASQPLSETGMFELVSGHHWLKKNYVNIFKPTSLAQNRNDDQPSQTPMSKSKQGDYKLLMAQMDQEQNATRVRHTQEYESYRSFQLKELQMLNPDSAANPPDKSLPKSISWRPSKIAIPPSEVALSKEVKQPITKQIPMANAISNDSDPPKRTRCDDVTSSPASSQSSVDQLTSIPNTKESSTKQSTAYNREKKAYRLSPPPPPSLPAVASAPVKSAHNRNEDIRSATEIPNGNEHRRSPHSERSRTMSPLSRAESRRARLSRRRERPSRSPNVEGSKYHQLPVYHPHSSRKTKLPPRSHGLPPVPMRQPRQEPRSVLATTKPRKPSIANPDAVSHQAPQAASGNGPPTVTSSKDKANDVKQRSYGDKNKRDFVPSALSVEMIMGQGMNVVRRYTGGKKPMEILGDPRDFDDAMHKPKPQTPIVQTRSYRQDQQGLCFMERNTGKVLASVAEVEPVIRNHFTRGSSNNMDM